MGEGCDALGGSVCSCIVILSCVCVVVPYNDRRRRLLRSAEKRLRQLKALRLGRHLAQAQLLLDSSLLLLLESDALFLYLLVVNRCQAPRLVPREAVLLVGPSVVLHAAISELYLLESYLLTLSIIYPCSHALRLTHTVDYGSPFDL